MNRLVIPKIGEIISIDCGEFVEVIDVSHEGDDPNLVQINTVLIQEKDGDEE